MGTVVQLKNEINNSYSELRNSVEDKLILVEEKIKNHLSSDVDLIQKMTNYHTSSKGKRLRALLTLGSAKLCGYIKGGRDSNHQQLREAYHHIPKPQARKIMNYLGGILEDAVRYSNDRRPGRRKKGSK